MRSARRLPKVTPGSGFGRRAGLLYTAQIWILTFLKASPSSGRQSSQEVVFGFFCDGSMIFHLLCELLILKGVVGKVQRVHKIYR